MKEKIVDNILKELLRLTDGGKPNINYINEILRDFRAIRLNIKNFGYTIGRQLIEELPLNEVVDTIQKVNLKSKATTQEDMESKWLKYWACKLGIAIVFHRKLWELCYVPQAISEYCDLSSGKKGLGFGCGEEPLPSLFASMGIDVTVTDLPPDNANAKVWVDTKQHTNNLEKVFYKDIIDYEVFSNKVDFSYVDMNSIPDSFSNKYDFCWSVCALEHLGSIQKGLDFIENSLNTLKPGGIAVHTTEYNYTNEPETIDNWMTVFYQQKHFEHLAKKLKTRGFVIVDFDFDIGDKPLDRFIDIPPFSYDEGWYSEGTWSKINQSAHLKLCVDGFPCTSFGLIIKKPK